MLPSLLAVGLVVLAQSPDGAGPAVSPPPPASSAPAAAPAPAPAPAATPAPEAAPPPAAAPAPAAAPSGDKPTEKKDAKAAGPKRDHISGLFVSGVGAAVVTLGAFLGTIGALFMFIPRIPFPGGDAERTTFTSSAVVGSTFMVLVGMSLVTVGVALVAVSFL